MILGLGYKARSGKDTVANYLVKNFGFKRIAFADPLKRGCMEIFGFSEEQVFGELKETVDPYWGFSPRYALQKVGTDCLRNGFDREIWVKAAGKRILAEPDTNWVITDCRFPNEAEAVHAWGGRLVKVDRPGVGASTGIERHSSEVAMESYDGWWQTIYNHGTLDELYEVVDEFWRQARGE
jgi:hypothetical protein